MAQIHLSIAKESCPSMTRKHHVRMNKSYPCRSKPVTQYHACLMTDMNSVQVRTLLLVAYSCYFSNCCFYLVSRSRPPQLFLHPLAISDCRNLNDNHLHPTTNCSFLTCIDSGEQNPQGRLRFITRERHCPAGRGIRNGYEITTNNPCKANRRECAAR